jgi:hypothetical protein
MRPNCGFVDRDDDRVAAVAGDHHLLVAERGGLRGGGEQRQGHMS